MMILFSPSHYIFDKIAGVGERSWSYNISDSLASKYNQSVVVTGKKISTTLEPYKVIELNPAKHYFEGGIFKTPRASAAFVFNLKYTIATFRETRRTKFDIVHHVLPFAIGVTYNIFIVFNRFMGNQKTIIGPLQSSLNFQGNDTHMLGGVSITRNRLESLLTRVFRYPLLKLSISTLNSANKIVVINHYTKDLLLNKGVHCRNIVIIPPGINTARFYCPKKNYPKEEIKIISVGFLSQRKGFDLVLKAFQRVIISKPQTNLYIVGTGPQMKALVTLSKKLKIENNIHFEGLITQDKLPDYYQKADIFVSMSRAESWGQVYLEAMACGLPVISARNVGSESIIREGEFGYLVKQEDIDQLTERILYLLNNNQILYQFGQAARKEVEAKYDWDNVIIPKYIRLYQELTRETQ